MNMVDNMEKEKKKKSVILEYLPYIIIIIAIILVRKFIVTPVRVSGNSMYPTLTDGQIMILNKVSQINRYDIVVVNKTVAGEEIIKRVIGIPGDSVEVVGGKLFINDEEIIDKYGNGETGDFYKTYLASDEYYVMGDNRSISLDSRVFGKIKKDDIEGVTNFILFPFNQFGVVENN